VCFNVVATHAQQRQLDVLLNERYAAWGDESWLRGKTPAAAGVLDPLVHQQNGCPMHGSRKKDQPAPYAATRLWWGKDKEDPVALADMSLGNLQRGLSILHVDTDCAPLAWSRPPPADAYAPLNKQRASGARTAAADALGGAATADVQWLRQDLGMACFCQIPPLSTICRGICDFLTFIY
jgi:hypothetical protein